MSDTNEVLVFERLPHAKAAGCIVYGLLIPVLAFVVWMVLGLLAAALTKWLGYGEKHAMTIVLVLGAASLALSIFVGVRDYRRRAVSTVRVGPDFIELAGRIQGIRMAFGDIAWFQGFGSMPLKVVSKARAVIHLRAEEWPVPKIREAFVARVLPPMKAQLVARMLEGRPVRFSSPRSQILRLVLFGVVLLLLGGAALPRMVTMTHDSAGQIWGQAALVFALLAGGVGCLIRANLERRSYVLEEGGIRAGKPDAPLLAWSDFREGRVSNSGLSLTFGASSRPVRISPLVRSYDLLVALVKSMTPADAWPGLASEDPAP